MTADSQRVRSKFTLIWKIREFREYLDLKRDKLEVPHFKIRCLETTKWCLSLRTRETFLDCFLNRLHRLDNLSEVQVKYNMYIIDENGNSHFEKSNIVTLDHDSRVIKEKGFLDCRSLEDRHLPGKSMNFQCDLELEVNQNKASKWNFNSDLISLSDDLMLIYGMEEISDEIITFAGMDFQVHNFIIAARCPQLFNDNADTYHSSSTDSTETAYTDGSVEHAISISPMRAICYYCHERENSAIPAYHDSDTEEWFVDHRTDEIFTRPVCEAALRYLYSGKVDVSDNKTKSQLYIIARSYGLSDLMEKLEDVPNTCLAVTEIAVDKMCLLFDTEALSQWAEAGFRPITRLINLAQTPYLRYLSVTFSILNMEGQGGVLMVSCRFIKGRFPITLKIRLYVYYTHLEETYESCKTFHSDEIWHPTIPINLNNKMTSFKCFFSACNTELKQLVKQEFFINSGESSHSKSLRQLSLDLASILHKTHNYDFDLTMIAKGKLVKAHRTIVYARSPIFREQLLPKMHDENRILHLVRRIDHVVLKKLIEYMYTGDPVLKDFPKVKELCAAAKRFQISELVNACNSHLETEMNEATS